MKKKKNNNALPMTGYFLRTIVALVCVWKTQQSVVLYSVQILLTCTYYTPSAPQHSAHTIHLLSTRLLFSTRLLLA